MDLIKRILRKRICDIECSDKELIIIQHYMLERLKYKNPDYLNINYIILIEYFFPAEHKKAIEIISNFNDFIRRFDNRF